MTESASTKKQMSSRPVGFGTRIMAMAALVISIIALISAFSLAFQIAKVDKQQSKKIHKVERMIR